MSDPSPPDLKAQHDCYTAAFGAAIREAEHQQLNELEAGDLAHDVTWKVVAAWMRDPPRFPDTRSLAAYTVRAVQNRVNNVRRDKRRRLRAELTHGTVLAESAIERSPADAKLAGEECAEAERLAIEALTPRARQVYLIAREGTFTYDEIGKQLGMESGTVHTHVSAANKLIRARMKQYRDAAGPEGRGPTSGRAKRRDQS